MEVVGVQVEGKHPEDNESVDYGVPFMRVQSQPEPHEYSFSHHKRRPDGATSLPRRSPRFPRRSPRFNGNLIFHLLMLTISL